jgi:superfamily II DNA or RNA helicase
MVNTTHPELKETKVPELPQTVNLETLKGMREDQCSKTAQEFKLQPVQRFLRRVLSPDSPVRNLLMVHGTGAGKTCTAIQIAEEYIIRPEFQDKRVLVLANPAIQENFKSQIFNPANISFDEDGLLLSKQCTGRRYLEMIQRSSEESLQYTDKASRSRIEKLANRIIGEFYEFQGYAEFSNTVDNNKLKKSGKEIDKWIHDTFDNRLIIVDEAHNLRDTSESGTSKLVGLALESVLKKATGITLVLLTATPMYDTFDEIVYYLNLFLWNDRRMDLTKQLKSSDIFTPTGEFKKGQEAVFRGWCADYVSYSKGENPFTFPYRLPPPDELIAEIDRDTDYDGKPITKPRKYLQLVKSYVHPIQEAQIKNLKPSAVIDPALFCAYPGNKEFRETFEKSSGTYKYRAETEKFLAPSKIGIYSSKAALIMKIIEETKGVVFIYSNRVEEGAQLFSMILEEHGYESALGDKLLETSGEVARGSRGKYVLFVADTSPSDMRRALDRLRRAENRDGSDIRIVVASPRVSEGVDFKYVRQIHILDPRFNMSGIEQIIGRGMRTCSHSLLDFEDQNCTVYLHVCRYPNSKKETIDEYIYRVFVEEKAAKIAKVKRIVMESAMDCELQHGLNNLPKEWREIKIPQTRNEDGAKLQLSLEQMFSPTFDDMAVAVTCKVPKQEKDTDHTRPLSAILDVRDEVFDKLQKIFVKKQIWTREDLIKHSSLKDYAPEVLSYLLQNAIELGLQLKDKNGRLGHLESKGKYLAFTSGRNQTAMDRILKEETHQEVDIPIKEEEVPVRQEVVSLAPKREALSDHLKTFPQEIQDWYVVDAVLTKQEKIDYMLTLNWADPPIYAKPLKTEHLYIFGLNQVYKNGELITPIGADLDEYNEWLDALKQKFIDHKDDFFASMKEDAIVFNLDVDSEEVKRAERKKNIGGRACTSYKEGVLNAFSRWIKDEGFPAKIKTKKDRCMYLNFIVREAILSGKDGLFWLTPEEFEILNEPSVSKNLRDKL